MVITHTYVVLYYYTRHLRNIYFSASVWSEIKALAVQNFKPIALTRNLIYCKSMHIK